MAAQADHMTSCSMVPTSSAIVGVEVQLHAEGAGQIASCRRRPCSGCCHRRALLLRPSSLRAVRESGLVPAPPASRLSAYGVDLPWPGPSVRSQQGLQASGCHSSERPGAAQAGAVQAGQRVLLRQGPAQAGNACSVGPAIEFSSACPGGDRPAGWRSPRKVGVVVVGELVCEHAAVPSSAPG